MDNIFLTMVVLCPLCCVNDFLGIDALACFAQLLTLWREKQLISIEYIHYTDLKQPGKLHGNPESPAKIQRLGKSVTSYLKFKMNNLFIYCF